MLALGLGFWLSALTTRYRDLGHVTGFFTQLWMYGTPVIYPLSKVPADWIWLAALNPLTSVTEATRILLLGRGTLEPWIVLCSIAVTLVAFISGIFAFQRAERNFIDTV
jgi:lipopolysaccharide transport system permease protein